jgi:hypothetical protein
VDCSTGRHPSKHKAYKPSGGLLIGTKGQPRLPRFKGMVDAVRVYDRVPSGEEALAHFQAEAGAYGFDPAWFTRVKVTLYYYDDHAVVEADTTWLQSLSGRGRLGFTLTGEANPDLVLAGHVIDTQRLYDGIVASEAELKPEPIETIKWRTTNILPPPRSLFSEGEMQEMVGDKNRSTLERNRSAFILAWLRRLQNRIPLELSAMHINDISLLHLPAECFIEYQLRAQEMQPSRFVATAAYGDDGPWYIPVKEEYGKGGYELSVAFCDPEVDDLLAEAIRNLLQA